MSISNRSVIENRIKSASPNLITQDAKVENTRESLIQNHQRQDPPKVFETKGPLMDRVPKNPIKAPVLPKRLNNVELGARVSVGFPYAETLSYNPERPKVPPRPTSKPKIYNSRFLTASNTMRVTQARDFNSQHLEKIRPPIPKKNLNSRQIIELNSVSKREPDFKKPLTPQSMNTPIIDPSVPKIHPIKVSRPNIPSMKSNNLLSASSPKIPRNRPERDLVSSVNARISTLGPISPKINNRNMPKVPPKPPRRPDAGLLSVTKFNSIRKKNLESNNLKVKSNPNDNSEIGDHPNINVHGVTKVPSNPKTDRPGSEYTKNLSVDNDGVSQENIIFHSADSNSFHLENFVFVNSPEIEAEKLEKSKEYYKLELNALDLEALYPKSRVILQKPNTREKFSMLAKNLLKNKTNPVYSGMSPYSQANTQIDFSIWASSERTKCEWEVFDTSILPPQVLNLVDLSVTSEFHVEFVSKKEESPLVIEHQEEYIKYYGDYFYGREHSNYIGYDEKSTHWVITIEDPPRFKQSVLRAIIRSKKEYLRVLIENVSTNRLAGIFKRIPELENFKFIKVKNPEMNDELRSMEEKEVSLGKAYKFGVLYVKPSQTEDEIYANNDPSEDFVEFLDFLGETIDLYKWENYRGGLDVKNRTTGEKSVYNTYDGIEIMFHVCTYLPYQENDEQRIERKRHIGNDVVTFIFLEKGCEPYLPTKMTSQFIHIHFVFQKVPNTGTDPSNPTKYAYSVVTKGGVDPCTPVLKTCIREKSKEFSQFILLKAINAERATLLSPEFKVKIMRARKDFLKHLYEFYSNPKRRRI